MKCIVLCFRFGSRFFFEKDGVDGNPEQDDAAVDKLRPEIGEADGHDAGFKRSQSRRRARVYGEAGGPVLATWPDPFRFNGSRALCGADVEPRWRQC